MKSPFRFIKLLLIVLGLIIPVSNSWAQPYKSRRALMILGDSIGYNFETGKFFDVVLPHYPSPLPTPYYFNPLNFCTNIGNSENYIYLKQYNQAYELGSVPGDRPAWVNGFSILDGKNRTIIRGDSLWGQGQLIWFWNGNIFIPLNDSLVYLISCSNSKGTLQEVLYSPDSSSEYDRTDSLNGCCTKLRYSRIEFNRKDTTWAVTEKDVIIAPDTDVIPKVTAVKHHNGKDWWIFSHERGTNGFLRFLATEKGIKQYPTQYIGRVHLPRLKDPRINPENKRWLRYFGDVFNKEMQYGQLKASKKGDLLACVGETFIADTVRDTTYSYTGGDTAMFINAYLGTYRRPMIDLFKVNRCTGELYHYKDMSENMPINIRKNYFPFISCEFSSLSKYLYFTFEMSNLSKRPFGLSDKIFRLNINSGVLDSISTDSSYLGSQNVYPGMLYLGNNDTIYVTPTLLNFRGIHQLKYMAYIAHPDSAIEKVGYRTRGLFLEGRYQNFSLPNNPHYDLGPLPPVALLKKPVSYPDTICPYDTARIGGYFPAGQYIHKWTPMSGLRLVEGDSGSADFIPPYIPPTDRVFTFILSTFGTPGSCSEGESTTDTFRIVVRGRDSNCYTAVPELPKGSPKIELYPNPTDGTLYIKAEKVNLQRFLLYELTGKLIFEKNLTASEATLHIGDLPDNVYLCKIYTSEGIFTQKVILKK